MASLLAAFFSMQDLKQPVSSQSDVDFAGHPDIDSDVSVDGSDFSDRDSDGGLSSDDAETIMGDIQRRSRRADADMDEMSVLALAATAQKLEAPRSDVAGARINRRARPKRAEDYTADEATRFFRFSPEDLRTLSTELRIPAKLRWESTTVGHWTQFEEGGGLSHSPPQDGQRHALRRPRDRVQHVWPGDLAGAGVHDSMAR